ncbi:MAG: CYTH domain-containing protein [Muribaculaceae bacterium]|nr:CYTH domain-containing protein [Muribaculaceae bacterium]
MATEIERKFLVVTDDYRRLACCRHEIRQGYLSRVPERTVRVRICDDTACITIKGRAVGAARPEFEYTIPLDDARQLMTLCEPPVIVKTRHIVIHEGNRWEVDEFHDELQGLVIAELEIPDVEHRFALPDFLGREVTDDRRYYNASLGTNGNR